MSGITEVNPLPPHYLCPKCHFSEFVDPSIAASGFDLPDKECPHCGTIMRGNGHNIPFQTFLGFDADKTPDIDLNFSNEYQAKAHAFIKEVFGESHAYRAGTIGTVAEKTAYGYVSGYCEKMNIPNMRRVMKDYLAVHCQDVKRTTGQHPGGIIIIPEEFKAEDFTPIQYPANDPESEWKTTHYDFHDIHDNVLKFDILGHVDPTAMRLLQNISDTRPTSIPMNDPETLSLFYSDEALHADPRVYKKETGALGLPEFGTRTTRRVLEETRPHVFSDLVIISGLSHGTDVWAGNAESLIQDGTCTLSEVIATFLLQCFRYAFIDSHDEFTGIRNMSGAVPEGRHNTPMFVCKQLIPEIGLCSQSRKLIEVFEKFFVRTAQKFSQCPDNAGLACTKGTLYPNAVLFATRLARQHSLSFFQQLHKGRMGPGMLPAFSILSDRIRGDFRRITLIDREKIAVFSKIFRHD